MHKKRPYLGRFLCIYSTCHNDNDKQLLVNYHFHIYKPADVLK
jgi:hypothetical protein